MAGFPAAPADKEARGFVTTDGPADLREDREPDGDMTEERTRAVPPDSATALLLLDGAREGRDMEDGVGLVPPARDVRGATVALAVEPEGGARVAETAVFDVAETLLVFFKGEGGAVVPAVLALIDVALVNPTAGFEVSGQASQSRHNTKMKGTRLAAYLFRGRRAGCFRHGGLGFARGTCHSR